MAVQRRPVRGICSGGRVLLLCMVLLLFSAIPHVNGLEPRWIHPTGGQDISSMAISANGSVVAVGTTAGDLILLDRSGTELWRQSVPGSVLVAVPPDGSVVLAGTQVDREKNKGAVRLYEQNGTLRWMNNTGWVSGLGISQDGKRVAAGMGDGDVFITDMTGTKPVMALTFPDIYLTRGFFIAPDGSTGGYIKCNDEEPTYFLMNLNSRGRTTVKALCTVMAFSGNASRIVTGFGEGSAGIVSLIKRDGKPLWTNRTGAVSAVAISSDGEWIVAATDNGLFLSDSSGNNSRIVPVIGQLTSLSMSRNGSFIATGSQDGTVSLYDRNGSALWMVRESGLAPPPVSRIVLSPDGSVLAATFDHSLSYFTTGVSETATPPDNTSTAKNTTVIQSNITTPAANATIGNITRGNSLPDALIDPIITNRSPDNQTRTISPAAENLTRELIQINSSFIRERLIGDASPPPGNHSRDNSSSGINLTGTPAPSLHAPSGFLTVLGILIVVVLTGYRSQRHG